jgi:hypothetical protein
MANKGGHMASQSGKPDDIDVLLSVSADFLGGQKEPRRAVIASVPSQQNSTFSSSSFASSVTHSRDDDDHRVRGCTEFYSACSLSDFYGMMHLALP